MLQNLFNNWVTVDGQPGPTGNGSFIAEPGRYHYYLSRGCPNCHRVAIALSLLELSDIFSFSFVSNVKRDNGWRIETGKDPIFLANSLQEIIVKAEGHITAYCTVPLLIDKYMGRIVSAQSADMVRMMDDLVTHQNDNVSKLWPAALSNEVDELNTWIRNRINSGVYEILFADTAFMKNEANTLVLGALKAMNYRLLDHDFLHGPQITASDIWLFPTLLRINSVYSELFGLSAKISDFPNFDRYLTKIWSIPAFRTASELDPIEEHYFKSIIHGPNGPVEPGAGMYPHSKYRFNLPHSE